MGVDGLMHGWKKETRWKRDSRISLKHTKESKRRISSFYIKFHMKNKERIYYNIITSTQKISMAITNVA